MKTNVLIAGLAATAFTVGFAGRASAQINVDGTLDSGYGAPLAVQTVNSGFGDSTVGDGTSSGGSELDALYGTVSGGNLYLFVAGNFENNGNHLNVFISDGRAGQSTLALASGTMSVMNGSIFSPGFQATFAIEMHNYQGTAYFDEYALTGTPSGGYAGSVPLTGGIGTGSPANGIVLGLNELNAAGVNGTGGTAANQAAAAAVTTGLEIAIPLSLLGNPSGSIQVLADINGGNDGYLSNQFLPGLAVGSGNLGGTTFNFGSVPGEFVTVPEPSTMVLGAAGLASLLLLRRRR